MLKGKAKTEYQREYMRRRRSVRPKVLDPNLEVETKGLTVRPIEAVVRPKIDTSKFRPCPIGESASAWSMRELRRLSEN